MKLWTVDADAAPSEPVRKVIQFTFFHCNLPIGNTEIFTVNLLQILFLIITSVWWMQGT